MRPLLCAMLVFTSLAVAEAQSGAPIHNAGRAIKRKSLKVGHKYRVAKHRTKARLRNTGAYVRRKYRGVKRAIKN